jgi:hypothetical protein
MGGQKLVADTVRQAGRTPHPQLAKAHGSSVLHLVAQGPSVAKARQTWQALGTAPLSGNPEK